MSVLDVLVGKQVQELLMDEDREHIAFVTDQGRYDFYCFADCCSESWINHVNFVDALIGGTVQSVDEVDMHSLLQVEPEATRQEHDQVMFYRIHTDKGTCVLEFRNSSNGYYGGELGIARGEVTGEPITEDF
jgi:hypothetical protein